MEEIDKVLEVILRVFSIDYSFEDPIESIKERYFSKEIKFQDAINKISLAKSTSVETKLANNSELLAREVLDKRDQFGFIQGGRAAYTSLELAVDHLIQSTTILEPLKNKTSENVNRTWTLLSFIFEKLEPEENKVPIRNNNSYLDQYNKKTLLKKYKKLKQRLGNVSKMPAKPTNNIQSYLYRWLYFGFDSNYKSIEKFDSKEYTKNIEKILEEKESKKISDRLLLEVLGSDENSIKLLERFPENNRLKYKLRRSITIITDLKRFKETSERDAAYDESIDLINALLNASLEKALHFVKVPPGDAWSHINPEFIEAAKKITDKEVLMPNATMILAYDSFNKRDYVTYQKNRDWIIKNKNVLLLHEKPILDLIKKYDVQMNNDLQLQKSKQKILKNTIELTGIKNNLSSVYNAQKIVKELRNELDRFGPLFNDKKSIYYDDELNAKKAMSLLVSSQLMKMLKKINNNLNGFFSRKKPEHRVIVQYDYDKSKALKSIVDDSVYCIQKANLLQKPVIVGSKDKDEFDLLISKSLVHLSYLVEESNFVIDKKEELNQNLTKKLDKKKSLIPVLKDFYYYADLAEKQIKSREKGPIRNLTTLPVFYESKRKAESALMETLTYSILKNESKKSSTSKRS